MREKALRIWRWSTTINSAISLAERLAWVAVVTGVPSLVVGVIVEDPWRFMTVGVIAGWVLLVVVVVATKRRAESLRHPASPSRVIQAPPGPPPGTERAKARAEAHRYPPAILAKPEHHRQEDIAAFCTARAALLSAGETFHEELFRVSIDAKQSEEIAWQGKMKPWIRRCRVHHERFWPGERYRPLTKSRAIPSIPSWAGNRQDVITTRLAWLREYGWGCDE